jgi:hypothetical protein
MLRLVLHDRLEADKPASKNSQEGTNDFWPEIGRKEK